MAVSELSGRRPGDPRPGRNRPRAADVIPLPAPRQPAGPAPRAEAPRRRTALLLLTCGLALIPWLILLALTLPTMTVAWVGLDAMEAAGLVTTGLLTLRGHALSGAAAGATAALLVADGWFDVTTAPSTSALAVALVMAAAVELPLAAVCVRTAVRAYRTPPPA